MNDSNHELVPLRLKEHHLEEQNDSTQRPGGFLVYVGFFGIFFVLSMLTAQVYVERYEQIQVHRKEVIELEKMVEELKITNKELLSQIEELKTSEGQEKIARKKLKLIKRGEQIVVWENPHD